MTQTTQDIDVIHEMYEYNIAGSSLANLFCLKKQKHQESFFHTRDTKFCTSELVNIVKICQDSFHMSY